MKRQKKYSFDTWDTFWYEQDKPPVIYPPSFERFKTGLRGVWESPQSFVYAYTSGWGPYSIDYFSPALNVYTLESPSGPITIKQCKLPLKIVYPSYSIFLPWGSIRVGKNTQSIFFSTPEVGPFIGENLRFDNALFKVDLNSEPFHYYKILLSDPPAAGNSDLCDYKIGCNTLKILLGGVNIVKSNSLQNYYLSLRYQTLNRDGEVVRDGIALFILDDAFRIISSYSFRSLQPPPFFKTPRALILSQGVFNFVPISIGDGEYYMVNFSSIHTDAGSWGSIDSWKIENLRISRIFFNSDISELILFLDSETQKFLVGNASVPYP